MVVSVLVEIKFKQKEKTFDYLVPSIMEDDAEIGKRVLVPFGKQILEGFIIGLKKKSDYKLKEIIKIIDKEPILNKELLELGKRISNENVCNLISIYQAMLPSGYKASSKTNINKKIVKYIQLVNKEDALSFLDISKAEKQKEIIKDLLKNEYLLKNKYNSQTINILVSKGLIKEINKEVYRINNNNEVKELNKLNGYQKKALDDIKCSNKDVILLNGVTGSGKTEIYMHLIDEAVRRGKEAIMLVPEISLTPQIIERFKVHFSSNIAILHSGLSDAEKYDEYRKIVRGEVSIVIGARSAVFAPLKNIGIIIIDEEHSSTYKQDHNPRYNAIDVAIERGIYHNAKVILGSATPSIESYARGKKGYYELVSLNKRANDALLPKVKVIDMKDEIRNGNRIFSRELLENINDRLEKNEQIMLLLNKRGYSSYLMCSNCGEVLKCPNCDITLTYHKTSDMNRCHYCGYAQNKQDKCQICKQGELKSFGIGTERVEEEIKKLFPNSRTLRMDIDTTSKKGAHSKIINSFMNHEADIMIGTQMISKGLDFPLVTLVGIINADTILNLPDFRASEKTYQLISQTSGRAGRGDIEGKVVIQTFNPDNYSINYAKNHDYIGFYNEEIKIRKRLKYPPYFFITLLKISGKDFNVTLNEAKKISDYVKNNKSEDMIALGPSISSVSKINNIYYFQIIIKFRDKEKNKELLNNLIMLTENNSKINLDIDVNPISL